MIIYLALSPHFLNKIRMPEPHSNVLLGEKKLYSLLHTHLGRPASPKTSLDPTALMLHAVASIASSCGMSGCTRSRPPLLTRACCRLGDHTPPGFSSVRLPVARASLTFSSLSSKSCLCSNCVLFLPLPHAAHQGDEQLRGVRV